MEYNKEKADEISLALLVLTSHSDGFNTRAWKGFDWDVLDRLHQKGFIENPVGKAKSVVFTEEGWKKAQELFQKHFGVKKRDGVG